MIRMLAANPAEPLALLAYLVVVLGGWYLHDAAQAFAAARLRVLAGPMRPRLSPAPGAHLDVYGCVAAGLGGVGWSTPTPVAGWRPASSRRAALALAAGPAVYLALFFGFAFATRASTGTLRFDTANLDFYGSAGSQLLGAAAGAAGSLFVLSVLPCPPLDGGRILFLLAPRTPGWSRAAYRLQETQLGVGIALAIMIVPLLFPAFRSVVGGLAQQMLAAVLT